MASDLGPGDALHFVELGAHLLLALTLEHGQDVLLDDLGSQLWSHLLTCQLHRGSLRTLQKLINRLVTLNGANRVEIRRRGSLREFRPD